MAYRQYNNRGRYNTPGQFVSAGEIQQNVTRMPYQPSPPPPSMNVNPNFQNLPQSAGVDMNCDNIKTEDSERPTWMKTKLSGLKKISNKERRRRQNAHLRRLLTPKNAVMVLNEMMPNEQVSNQYKVEPNPTSFYQKPSGGFRADLTLQGTTYQGFGENKMMARNHAAEQAVRDLVLKKMGKLINSDSESNSGDGEEDVLPMIQLASFALYKLFTEWECEGHRVPQLKPSTTNSMSEQMDDNEELEAPQPKKAKVKAPKLLPQNASAMHPCMLLTYMRANLDYNEYTAQGNSPQNMVYAASIDVDGQTFTGTGPNKKEARRNAAKAACETVFHVVFDPKPTSNMPIPATS